MSSSLASGQTVSDDGAVRVCADNSPPSGVPGVLVGFIEEAEAFSLAGQSVADRRAAVLATLVRYFGAQAGEPLEYREKNWGDDPFCPGCGRRLLAGRRVDQIRPSFACPVRVAALGGNGDRLNLERQDGGGLASGEACDSGGAFANKQQA
jgi:monoamine oxidase